jgi:uncharacterized membrane protein YkoI
MHSLLLAISLLAGLGLAARAEGERDAPPCLSPGDTADIVTAHKVVAPGEALVRVRKAVPDSDVLRAALCRGGDALVYEVTVLRRDGKVVRVTVDAPSGKVKTIH